jgi:hypothetical protein
LEPDDPLGTLSAAVDLPFPGLERAIAALRGQLRSARDDRALAAGLVGALDCDTLAVDGPVVGVDLDVRSWFAYTAQVCTRALRPWAEASGGRSRYYGEKKTSVA